MTEWGLRGRWFRRFLAASIIVSTSSAAILDEACCCCDCSGQWTGIAYPAFETIDPLAQERLRGSPIVQAAVGPVTTITVEEEAVISSPRIDLLYTTDTSQRVYKIAYLVTGASGTMTFFVFAIERDGAWVIEAIESADGAYTDGTVPSTRAPGGGGGWD